MFESPGTQLQRKRVARGISREQAAKATRIRVERIADLEADDYSNFPNLAYAKGFLVIYSKYLGVDLTDFSRKFDTGNPVGVDDYAYLSHPVEDVSTKRARPREPSGNPALALVTMALLGFAAIAGMYVWTNAQRLGMAASGASRAADRPDGPTGEALIPPPASIASQSEPSPEAAPSLEPVAEDDISDDLPVVRAEVVHASADDSGAEHEIILRPLKKTRVIVRHGGSESAPIFEGYLDPDNPPMRFRGTDFYIQLNDERGVEISKNGERVAYRGLEVAIP